MKNIEKMCIFKTVNIKFTSQESAYTFHYKHETQKQKARVFYYFKGLSMQLYLCFSWIWFRKCQIKLEFRNSSLRIVFLCTQKNVYNLPTFNLQEPHDRFVSNVNWGTRENHGNVHSLVLRFKVKWVDLYMNK